VHFLVNDEIKDMYLGFSSAVNAGHLYLYLYFGASKLSWLVVVMANHAGVVGSFNLLADVNMYCMCCVCHVLRVA